MLLSLSTLLCPNFSTVFWSSSRCLSSWSFRSAISWDYVNIYASSILILLSFSMATFLSPCISLNCLAKLFCNCSV